ncbi:hypothetical protein PWT90_10125 [Aphanocladium album]|nr:hypothetical protein PWT90_10125 [Aphanocladium album]
MRDLESSVFHSPSKSTGQLGGTAWPQIQIQHHFRANNGMARRGPSHAGPYGLACSNCFKAKSKCVALPEATDTACQRCKRLGKTCQPSDSYRQRTIAKKSNTSTSRIAELEGKVDSLLAQLQSRDGKNLPRPSSGSTEESVMPSIEVDSDFEVESEAEINATDNASEESDIGETLLNKFRSTLLPSFPFMHLPSHITSQSLKTEWPLLSRAINFVAQAPQSERLQSADLKRAIGESLLELDTKPTNLNKIGLLLAIVTYLAWGCDHIFYDGSISRLMMQATTLAMELMQMDYIDSGLVKPAVLLLGTDRQQDASGTTEKDFFLDRRRAILGCYVLSSAVSTYLGRTNTFQWTHQLEESLAAIRVNRDCPSDVDFALLVQLQLLAEKASNVRARKQANRQKSTDPATPSITAISLISLRNELEGIRVSLPAWRAQSKLAKAHMHWVESRLNEIAYIASTPFPIEMNQTQRVVTDTGVVESTGWNLPATPTTADTLSLLDHLIKKCHKTEEVAETGAATNAIHHFGQKMSKLRASIVTDEARKPAKQRTDTTWVYSKAISDGCGTTPCTIARLEDTLRPRRGPFDYVFE